MNKLNVVKMGYVVGTLTAALFLVCSAWGFLLGTPELQELHFNLLQIMFPGFSFAIGGYLIGLIEAFVYGWFAGAFFAWLCKAVCVNNEK